MICEHYLDYGIDILGEDIEEAILTVDTFDDAVTYLNNLYFGQTGYYEFADESRMRPEYFGLPLAIEEEITYE